MKRVRIAVVGAGAMARSVYLPALAAISEEVILDTVVDIDQVKAEWAKERYGFRRAAAHVSEVREGDVEAALVITPVREGLDAHYEPVMELCRRGIYVLCEKPLTLSRRRLEQMAAQPTLMPIFNRRFTPVYQQARRLFCGESLQCLYAQKSGRGPVTRELLTNSIHILDVMRWMAGEVREVEAMALSEDPKQELALGALLRFASGAVGIFHMSRGAGQWVERLEATGHGRTVCVEAPHLVRWAFEDKVEEYRPDLNRWIMPAEAKFGFTPCLQRFLAWVRGIEPEAGITGPDAAQSYYLADRILRTAGLPGLDE
ncbi:MAG TPA: Gfo/Idh/MocA family oxidoreductase [Firmicutes bacterium]|nr:Gfo/Idh/MocA family oxidoreductase [Bacillota bacterium]